MENSRSHPEKSLSLMSRSGRHPSWCPRATGLVSPCAERITHIRGRAAGVSQTSRTNSKVVGRSSTTISATGRRRFSRAKQPCTLVPTALRVFFCRSFPHGRDGAKRGSRVGCREEDPSSLTLVTRHSLPKLVLGAVPAVSRNVEHDAVWVAELVLGTGRGDAGRPRVALTALGLNPLLRCVDIVHPDAEVVHSDEVLAPLIAGVRVGLELKQRHVHHSV